jgi:hypothetical protein
MDHALNEDVDKFDEDAELRHAADDTVEDVSNVIADVFHLLQLDRLALSLDGGSLLV